MTAAWTKGKTRHYPYYSCMTRGCEAKSKSVPRAKLEEGFAEIMKSLQPVRGLFDLAEAMMRDAWSMRLAGAHSVKDELQKQLRDAERQIEGLLDRVVEASSTSVISAYEARIEKLEREKIVLAERVANVVPPTGRLVVLQERIELSTSPLPRECSTTELLQRRFVGRGLVAIPVPRKGNLDPSGNRV